MLKAMDRLRTRLRTVLQVQRDLLDSSAQNAAIACDKPQQLPGVYGELIEAVQGAVHRGQQDYRAVREELLSVTGAISRGDFSLKLDATHKEGMWRELAEVLNQLTDRLGTALDDIAKQLAQVAAGDLRHASQREYSGLLGEVVTALASTSDNLSQIIETIRTSADSVAAEARRIATTNATLATHAELQVDALSRSSTAVDRLTDAAGESAANALEANRLMQSTSERASLGSELNARVVAAMQSIQTVTRRVSDFVGVINGVSFQTNILALNAAVEAARAGEQGRSFAVVAGEVRTLASRTAEAAREIERLVAEANAQVAAGAELVVQAGTSMGTIVTNVSAATAAIGDISRSSQEQSRDLQDVKRQLDQLRKTTDQTASTIEGAATVSQSLVGAASNLLESVAVFQTASAVG
jgi:methyl-accepting chemotaxis protein